MPPERDEDRAYDEQRQRELEELEAKRRAFEYSPEQVELAVTGAEYLLHLERMVDGKLYGVREAVQKAFAAGVTRGKIAGLDMARGIHGATAK